MRIDPKWLRTGDQVKVIAPWGEEHTVLWDNSMAQAPGFYYELLLSVDPKRVIWVYDLRVGDEVLIQKLGKNYGRRVLVDRRSTTKLTDLVPLPLVDVSNYDWTLVTICRGNAELATEPAAEIHHAAATFFHEEHTDYDPAFSKTAVQAIAEAKKRGEGWVRRNFREWPFGKRIRFEEFLHNRTSAGKKGGIYHRPSVRLFWEDDDAKS